MKIVLDTDSAGGANGSVLQKKAVLKNLRISTGKTPVPRPANLVKKRLWGSFFPVNSVKFLKAPFLQKTSGRLLLIRDADSYPGTDSTKATQKQSLFIDVLQNRCS